MLVSSRIFSQWKLYTKLWTDRYRYYIDIDVHIDVDVIYTVTLHCASGNSILDGWRCTCCRITKWLSWCGKHSVWKVQKLYFVSINLEWVNLHRYTFMLTWLTYRRFGGLVAKSCPTLATPWTVACQVPLSMEFSRHEYWSGLLFPSPGIFPTREFFPGFFSTQDLNLDLLHCRRILYRLS